MFSQKVYGTCAAWMLDGPEGGVAHQLRGAPDEGQELVVIQPPDTVRPGRLQPGMKHARSQSNCLFNVKA